MEDCDRARAMEYEDCLLQGAPYDILEEYFPRPNIVMPPPPQQVPEASQPIEPKQPGRKRVSRNEEDVNNGMTDEDIQAFLSTRSKRGRGSIGARVEKKSSSFSRLRTSSSSSSSYHEHCRRETDHGDDGILGSRFQSKAVSNPEWSLVFDGRCCSNDSLCRFVCRVREHVWSRVTMVTTTSTTTTESVVAAELPKLSNPVEAWRNGVAEVTKLSNPVEAWRNGVFGTCRKRDHCS
ncbi:hypothetical protein LINGRAPRIM_LOCUS1499 [Linum grandiflorum]